MTFEAVPTTGLKPISSQPEVSLSPIMSQPLQTQVAEPSAALLLEWSRHLTIAARAFTGYASGQRQGYVSSNTLSGLGLHGLTAVGRCRLTADTFDDVRLWRRRQTT